MSNGKKRTEQNARTSSPLQEHSDRKATSRQIAHEYIKRSLRNLNLVELVN